MSQRLQSTFTFAASPQRVADMLVSQEFADRAAADMEAIEHRVEPGSDTLTVWNVVPSPDKMKRIVGKEMEIKQTTSWEPWAGDGSRRGHIQVLVEKMKTVLEGEMTLTGDDAASTVVYDSQLTIDIPILGPKLEESAVDSFADILAATQQIGDGWLAEQAEMADAEEADGTAAAAAEPAESAPAEGAASDSTAA
ncbi:MAG: DUF2505 domain-containing protein [Propionibacteriaceae bacterium]|jgi:hypothetical protein|nr:DUF2505 domain-containing protein [Propionibacteriaceae bacterium]